MATTAQKPKKTKNGASSKPRKRRNAKQQQQQSNYPEHLTCDVCQQRYHNVDALFVRGTLRSVNQNTAFVACDRGRFSQDILIPETLHRNRALHGDVVYVELIADDSNKKAGAAEEDQYDSDDTGDSSTDSINELWQDDSIQMSLYNPQVTLERPKKFTSSRKPTATLNEQKQQPRGRVVHVVHPRSTASEIHPNHQQQSGPAQRTIVGSIKKLNDQIVLLTPCQTALVQFKCRVEEVRALEQALAAKENSATEVSTETDWNQVLVKAVYTYGSWKPNHTQWPPCTHLQLLGNSFVVEHQIEALLQTYEVDHGPDFTPAVLQDVEQAVESGRSSGQWEPTPDMCQGRRDYRTSRRVFTIDPTTAKDLDDALHIMEHPDGTVEVGVVRTA